MKHYYSHYWAAPTVEWHSEDGYDGAVFDHTAGKQFAHVRPGDDIYGWRRNANGDLLLIGRLTACTVDDRLGNGDDQRAVFSQSQAELVGGPNLWVADHHLFGHSTRETTMSFSRVISAREAVDNLRFIHAATGALLPPKTEAPGVLDRQTLRGVRRLTQASAAYLDARL